MNKENEIDIKPVIDEGGNRIYTLSDGRVIRIYLQPIIKMEKKILDYLESTLKTHLNNENINISQNVVTQRVNEAFCKYWYAIILEFHPLEATEFALKVLFEGYPNTHNFSQNNQDINFKLFYDNE